MRYEYPEDEDENEAYERIRQHDIDRLADKLAMAETKSAPRVSLITEGLLQFYDFNYTDIKRGRSTGCVDEGTDKTEGTT